MDRYRENQLVSGGIIGYNFIVGGWPRVIALFCMLPIVYGMVSLAAWFNTGMGAPPKEDVNGIYKNLTDTCAYETMEAQGTDPAVYKSLNYNGCARLEQFKAKHPGFVPAP